MSYQNELLDKANKNFQQKRKALQDKLMEKECKIEEKRTKVKSTIDEKVKTHKQKTGERNQSYKAKFNTLMAEIKNKQQHYFKQTIKATQPQSAINRRNASPISITKDTDKVSQVKQKAEQDKEALKKKLQEKLDNFETHLEYIMQRNNREMQIRVEREKVNNQKKEFNSQRNIKRKTYQKELLLKKMEADNKKAIELENVQKLIANERFIIKAKNDMKKFHLKETLLEMAITKQWSLAKIEKLINAFQSHVELDPNASIQAAFSKVFVNPFKTCASHTLLRNKLTRSNSEDSSREDIQ